jgi:hypothetical protein
LLYVPNSRLNFTLCPLPPASLNIHTLVRDSPRSTPFPSLSNSTWCPETKNFQFSAAQVPVCIPTLSYKTKSYNHAKLNSLETLARNAQLNAGKVQEKQRLEKKAI